MRLFRVMLEVADLDKAAKLYATLFDQPGRAVGGGRHYFTLGDIIVGIVDVSSGDLTPTPSGQDLYVAVPDLESAHDRARALGILSTGEVHGEHGGAIVTRPWGERSFYAVDPWGNGICFVDENTLFTGRQ